MATRAKTDMSIETFRSRAQKIADRIAKDRDELRNLVNDYSELLESVEQAHESLESAIDQLSELV